MQTPYDPFPGYQVLRPVAKFAGIIGVLQSLGWIGLTIVGVSAYYCALGLSSTSQTDVRLSDVTGLAIYQLYFKSECGKDDVVFPPVSLLPNSPMKLKPSEVNTWMWVYMVMSFIWLLSSGTLLLQVHKKRLVFLNIILLLWVLITLAISAMDLGLAVLFGMDYGSFWQQAYILKENYADAGVFMGALIGTFSMMMVALRGCVLWLINVGLLCYFFKQAIVINKAISKMTGLDNEGFTSETQSDILRQPIDAYGKGVEQAPYQTQLNVEPLKRATAMSIDTLLQRHYQRYPPGNDIYEPSIPKTNGLESLTTNNTFKPQPNVPDPDYSPRLSRPENDTSQPRPLKSALRNSRYQ